MGSKSLIDTAGPEPGASINDVRLTVGRIGGVHGIEGEVRLLLLTDQPDHLLTLSHVFLGDSENPVRLEQLRFHGDAALIKFAGVDTPEAAKALGGLPVRIAGEQARPLGPGEYFLFQLIGLQAIDERGERVGVVTDLIETSAHDVLVITPAGGGQAEQILVPNHPEFVQRIAPEDGRIEIRLPRYA